MFHNSTNICLFFVLAIIYISVPVNLLFMKILIFLTLSTFYLPLSLLLLLKFTLTGKRNKINLKLSAASKVTCNFNS